MSQGMKHDAGKGRFSLLPGASVWAVVQVLEFGARKYAPHSWQTVPDAFTRYMDALHRHAWALEQEDLDSDSGLEHVAHLACNAMFLVWLFRNRPEQVQAWRTRQVDPPAKTG